jgi:hypothetical protein
MIKTPTTFVIGAGGSCAYGIPAAEEIYRRAKAVNVESDIYQFLLTCSFGTRELDSFLRDLRRTPIRSLDSFLEKRQKEPDKMRAGRAFLALLVGLALGHQKHDPKDEWLGEIIHHMHRGAATFDEFIEGNNVRFVTFNFDTLIEDRISTDVAQLFDGVDDESLRNRIPVVHVHGTLPAIPANALKTPDGDGYPRHWGEWLPTAAAQINVVHDAIDDATLSAAAAAVRRAEVLCFLGFAYETVNLARLGLPAAFENGFSPHLFGSAYGLTRGQQASAAGRMKREITLGSEEQKSLAALLQFHVFRD